MILAIAGAEPGLAIQKWRGQIHFQDFPLEVIYLLQEFHHINNLEITTVSQDRRRRREIANNQFVQPHHVRETGYDTCLSNADPLYRRGLDSTPPGA